MSNSRLSLILACLLLPACAQQVLIPTKSVEQPKVPAALTTYVPPTDYSLKAKPLQSKGQDYLTKLSDWSAKVKLHLENKPQ